MSVSMSTKMNMRTTNFQLKVFGVRRGGRHKCGAPSELR
jgi:hypothetical protein